MFVRIAQWIRQVIDKVFNKDQVARAVKTDVAVSPRMSTAIDLWVRMYHNKVPWLSDTVTSANLAAAVASEVARLTTLEMVSEIKGDAKAKFLNSQYQPVIGNIRRYLEYGCAKGGLVFKPYLLDGCVAVDYVQADCFYPTAFDSSGRMIGCVFIDQIMQGGQIYTRFEHHKFEGRDYSICNTAYESNAPETIGRPIPLNSVWAWVDLQEKILIQEIKQPLFGFFKVPAANTVDTTSPLGVSVYSRAVDLIKEADKQYSRILWEYEGSELAIDADMTMFRKNGAGEFELPHGKERLFRIHNFGTGNEKLQAYNPDIRDASLFNGYNNLLKRIEFNCGLAYGTLSDPQNVDKTAEEIKASKQRSYAMISDNQKALKTALEDLVYAMDIWATIGHLAPAGNYEITFNFDDSIVNDPVEDRARDKEDVRDGIMSKVEYRMKWYGEGEKQARKMIAQAAGDEEKVGLFGNGDGDA